jgi:chloramphenicol-sensitive protein RarD
MLVGVLFFHERLRRMQTLAVALATTGVLVLAVSGGQVPWVGLFLAISFTAYAVIRKKVVIGAMPGLFVETLLLLPFALSWLGWLYISAAPAFAAGSTWLSFWLIMAGPVTALPLLCFTIAARRLPLTLIGFMQFLAPTLQFGTGIYFGEQLTPAHIVCFGLIWMAVIVFSLDIARSGRRAPVTA